ncbi:MAG TPA: FISUMP domain-containing protein [Bacteroidales bacterium]|nr:FISUMP domain-containing protein [Bacteroidales bacterium]
MIRSRLLFLFFAAFAASCLKLPDRNNCDQPAPDVVTDPASFISADAAIINGRFAAHGQNTVVTFEFGLTDSYGQLIEPYTAPVNNVNFRTVSFHVTGLLPSTTYHFRLKAEGECKEMAGEDITFTTISYQETGIIFNPAVNYGSVSDIDGNIYKTVTIGSLTWMAENLRTQRLNDASGMINDVNNHSWASRTDPAYCYYSNGVQIRFEAGSLYNWYAVGTGKLCPAGWHVSTDEDWNNMVAMLGGETAAAVKLKMTGNNMWPAPNTASTNQSGFTALPAGLRYGYIGSNGGFFYDMGWKGVWWTSTQTSIATAKYREIDQAGVISGTSSTPGKYQLNNKNFGFSVRCVKD